MSAVAKKLAYTVDSPYLGLAPFLRDSIAGKDLRTVGAGLLAQLSEAPTDASLLMNLSLAMQCIGQRDLGLTFQNEALSIKRIYHLPAREQPARLRLLMLMVPGDIAANTPMECLLEYSDIDLIYYYLDKDRLFGDPIPAHDVLLVALANLKTIAIC